MVNAIDWQAVVVITIKVSYYLGDNVMKVFGVE